MEPSENSSMISRARVHAGTHEARAIGGPQTGFGHTDRPCQLA
jgi:hypothetical protein